MIKQKPWLVRLFNKDPRWITIYPNIYAQKIYFNDPTNSYWTPIVEHEKVHLEQQRTSNRIVWYFKYLFNKHFRLLQECEGIAAELAYTVPSKRQLLFDIYCTQLAGSEYMKAASTRAEAELYLKEALIRREIYL